MNKCCSLLAPALLALACLSAAPVEAYELTEEYGFLLTDLDADEVCEANDVAFILRDDANGDVHFYEICNAFLAVKGDQVFNLAWQDFLALQERFELVETIAECTSDEGWGAVVLREADGALTEKHFPCWRY